MAKLNFLVCILLLIETSVLTLESLGPGQNLELQALPAKLNVEKIKVLKIDKEDDNSTEQVDVSSRDVSNDAFEENDADDEEEEKVEDFVDEELEQRDLDMMLDATGGESDVDINHRSFFGSIRMEAVKKACKYQCDKKCYDPHQQQCCKKKIVKRPWRCCAHSCGNVCYDQKAKQCCNGKVILKSQNCAGCVNKCGRMCFDPRREKCCNGKVVLKNAPCCKPGFNLCGQRCFDPRHHKCCHGIVTPKNFAVCGKKCYDPKVHHCCNGRVVSRRVPCCYRCGGACIDPRLHKCCHQRRISRNVPCVSGQGTPLTITKGLSARRVGCYRDTWNRAIPSLESKSYILIGNYQKRPFAIEKCALAAAKLGWSVFAVQHQGWCASSPTAGHTYNKYGHYNTCRNGKGGPWGNDVYVLEGNAAKKTTSGDICVFPFIYKGKLYNGCTRVDHNRPWCAITPNYDVDRLWGHC